VLRGGMRSESGLRPGFAEGLQQTAMNGGGGLAVQLLIDDRLHQGLKRRLRAGDAQPEGAGALDQAAQPGVRGCKLLQGLRNVVAGRPGSGDRSRHM